MSKETDTEKVQESVEEQQSQEDLEKSYKNDGKFRLAKLRLMSEHNDLLRSQIALLAEQNLLIKSE